MTEFTHERIAELRELASKATPTPWVAEFGLSSNSLSHEYIGWAKSPDVRGKDIDDVEYKTKNDRLYMEEACNALPGLLDEIERLRKWIDEVCS